MAKSKKEKASSQQQAQQELPDLKSKVLLKDRQFVQVIVGDDCLASMPIRCVLEEIYEKSNKRALWENFFKKWRPTVLKMEGCKMEDIRKEILGK